MSSVEVQESKPAVAKGWDSLPTELHLAIFREFLAIEEHVDHHYPDSCREILETPSNWDLSTRRAWHMYRRRNAIAPLDVPIDQNTSKCDACVDINSALTVCRLWNTLLKDQILRRSSLELIIYRGSSSLATSALRRWTAQAVKLSNGGDAPLPWVLDSGTDLLAVAVRRGLPDCIGPLVDLFPRKTVMSLFGGDWVGCRCYAHVAAASGNVDVLRLLKLHGFNLHQEDTRRRTPVCIAIRCNNMRAVEYLLSIENTKRRFDRDALSYAVYFGPVTTVKLVAQHILDRCRSWEERVEVYSAALSWSLRRHDLSTNDEAARYLVEELPDKHLVGMGPKYIITAIHHGACVKLIKHLIDKGADVNTSSPSHLEVPLEAAINRGDEEIIRLLLDSRAKCTPQALCRASTSTEEILDLVFSYYVYRDIDLYQCVTLGNAAVVKRLLTFGKNPNPSTGSANALQMAVLRGSLDIAKMLLEAGANPNHFVDNFMEGAWGTPLYIATSHSNIPLVKLLLHHGADTTCCSHWRRKPILHVNVGQGPMPVIKVLVDYDHS